MHIKSILIASDLSARSDRALQRGFLLAHELDAQVQVVSIIDDSVPESLALELVDKFRAHLEASAKSIAENLPYTIHIETGDPIARLVEFVNSAEVDLVVMGRHRARRVFDGLRKTTVESVVSQSLTPVLLVTDPVQHGYARVLAPVAFSAACRQAVTTALSVAPEATYRVFHAWMAPFEGLTGGKTSDYARAVQRETAEQSATWSAGLPTKLPKVDLVQNGVGTSCYNEIKTFAPDLIAVGATTRTLSFTGLGSFAAELLRDPPADLLIARGAEY
ncbi:universal stress protein [Pseudooceanicola sp.]|uniref:universal stress protein n=1 Tax=Pseudooceanicola sp. TaxID=1914328 RepID=UPI002604627C|nr:universal stress protein [Pseudooceanicola sp.]MDF1855948.1 universal stress protein [Pseudooceanicola sp.]